MFSFLPVSSHHWHLRMCLLQSYESLNSLNRFCAGLCPISGLELWYLVGFYLGVLYHDEFISMLFILFVSYIDGFNVETKTILWLWEEYTKRFTMWTSNCSLVRNGLCKLHLRMACAYILAKLVFWHNLCFWSRLFLEHVILVLSPPPVSSYKTKGAGKYVDVQSFFLSLCAVICEKIS